MFESYKDIFDVRAAAYHEAMLRWPAARAEELARAAALVSPRPGAVLVDVPSGGGYLRGALAPAVRLVAVETSKGFVSAATAQPASQAPGAEPTLLCDALGRLPLAGTGADAVVNLAGLHHEADTSAFYREAHRVLRPGGVLGLADVRQGSPVDEFLNGFVAAHASMGHDGRFLGPSLADELRAAGFEVEHVEAHAYPWRFASEADVGPYCRLLFGIDEADDDTILAGVREVLGCKRVGDEWHMGWELLFARAHRPR